MIRQSAFLVVTLAWFASANDPAPGPGPEWLWFGEDAQPGQVVYFRKSFDLKDARQYSGRLVATADNTVTVYLNGEKVLSGSNWSAPAHAGVTSRLREGRNVIAAKVTNTDSAKAGFLAVLDLDKAFSQPSRVETNGTWKASREAPQGWNSVDFDDATWRGATSLGKVGVAPWSQVTARLINTVGRSEAAGATPAARLKVRDGFHVQLLYSVPRDEQGSWVSMCHDPKGRLIVSDQYGGLFRVTPPPVGGQEPTRVEKLPIALGEAQGLLYAFDSLYVVVNRGEKYTSGLWRVRADGDGWGQPELLRELQGSGEHGPHAVLLNPDGKSLSVVIGNHTRLTDCATSRVPRRWAEDQIIPRMWDARGHARGILAPGGYIATCDPDGKTWELVSIGYRNAYDAAFSRHGELFTYDSDMEWDMNTPWYRPTRVCHVVSGSEFGWRSGSGKWPAYYPDSLPATVDIGPGSPTGTTFGTGARFPAKYQDALFICDWSYGKLYAVHLAPEGSSFKGTAEEFVSGLPLPLTDIVINPADGAMYFAIGGRKTTSGLYRVTYVGKEPTAPSDSVPAGGELRDLRRKLETYHRPVGPEAVKAVWPTLGHPDRFIRSAARVALEHQETKYWRNRALSEKEPAAALTALLALARCGDFDVQEPLFEALGRISWDNLSDAQRLELLRIHQLALLRLGTPEPGVRNRVLARISPRFPARSREVNSETAKLLSHLQDPTLAVRAVPYMNAAPTQEEQMDYANALKSLAAGWSPELRMEYFGWFRRAAGYRGGNSFAGFVDLIRAEAITYLTTAEKDALGELLNRPPTVAAAPPAPRTFVKKWTTEELLPLVDGQLSGRNFDRGRELFSATRCVSCHRYGNDGGANGPDLTGAAGRFSVRDLIESMTEPSKVISDQYGSVSIVTADGKQVNGRIINLSGDSIMLNTDMLDPNAIAAVNRNLIESMEPSKVSMMPDGLIDTCTEDEIRDLIAYLLSRGDRNGPMFKK